MATIWPRARQRPMRQPKISQTVEVRLDDADYEESWSDGLIMFHKPRALRLVDPEIFFDMGSTTVMSTVPDDYPATRRAAQAGRIAVSDARADASR